MAADGAAPSSSRGPPARGLADQSLRLLIGRMAPAVLLVQLAGLLFSVALARVLGSSTGTDAYFIALSVPATIYLVMLAALRQGATPGLTDILARLDLDFARVSSQLVSSVAVISAVLSVLVTAVGLFTLPLALGDDAPRLVSQVQVDLVVLAPLPVLGAITGSLAAIQTVRGSVVPAVAVSAFEPIAKMAFVVTLGPSIGAMAVVIGHVTGSTLAAAVLWVMLRRSGLAVRLAPVIMPPFVRSVLRLSTPLVVSQLILQANPIIDRTMAAPLGPGSVTQLELGMRLFFGATALLTGTLIGPLIGTWSARRLDGGWEALRVSVVRAVITVLIILPPLLTLGLALRQTMVDLIFGGGAYSDRALRVSADVLGMLVLGLPAQVLVVVFASLFVVQRSTVLPMLVGIANVVLNVGLNFALRPLWGTPGIALSTSLTVTLLLVPYVASATTRWDLRLRQAGASAARAAVAGAILAAAAIALMRIPWDDSGWARLAEVTVVTAVVLPLHAAALLLTREPMALSVGHRVLRMLTRRPTTAG